MWQRAACNLSWASKHNSLLALPRDARLRKRRHFLLALAVASRRESSTVLSQFARWRVPRKGAEARMTTNAFWVICYILGLIVFVNRYIAGIVLRIIRRNSWDEARDDFEPTVVAVVPMFNEGVAIRETLQSLLDSSYPHSKLRVVCVDDCSTDDSYDHATEIA